MDFWLRAARIVQIGTCEQKADIRGKTEWNSLKDIYWRAAKNRDACFSLPKGFVGFGAEPPWFSSSNDALHSMALTPASLFHQITDTFPDDAPARAASR